MRTWAVHTKDGRSHGFEISNLTITRSGVVRLIRDIPGAVITSGERYVDRRNDEFCYFTINGAKFVALEPFGDNSRYLICAEDESGIEHVATVERVFAARKLFGGG